MTIFDAERDLIRLLLPMYGEREAAAISDRVMEYLLQWKKIDRIIHKTIHLTQLQENELEKFRIELKENKPLQYVINEAWFMGMKFYVDESVLIPRPETEELVEWVLQDLTVQSKKAIRILDIGSGSGCIAIALKMKLPQANIISCEISQGALSVAKRNAQDKQVLVDFVALDFLNEQTRNKLPAVDIIVSNPPYISMSEYDSLDKHVSHFEPHQALFVPDENALVFYEAIAEFAQKNLRPGGKIFAELNEKKASDVKELLSHFGFANIEIRKDIQGTDRLIKATSLL
jgi:release factor glutamine methyltransferase